MDEILIRSNYSLENIQVIQDFLYEYPICYYRVTEQINLKIILIFSIILKWFGHIIYKQKNILSHIRFDIQEYKVIRKYVKYL